jgi:imidazolonepropionase
VLASALRHGTVTMEAKSGVGLDQSGEIKLLRMYTGLGSAPLRIVPTCYAGRVMPPSFQDRNEYTEWILGTLLPLVSRWKAAKFFDVFCGPEGFNLLSSSHMLAAAARHGLHLKLTASNLGQSDAIRLAVQRMACGIDGLTSVEDEDADVLAASDTVATLLPGASFLRNAGPTSVARTLIDRGAAVALATGFHRSELPTHSMQMAISLAYSHWNMSPAEALTAATINAAHALMVGDYCGSLQFGKDADIVILNTSDYRDIAYHFGVNFVQCTMRRGNVVFQEGEVDWPEKL